MSDKSALYVVKDRFDELKRKALSYSQDYKVIIHELHELASILDSEDYNWKSWKEEAAEADITLSPKKDKTIKSCCETLGVTEDDLVGAVNSLKEEADKYLQNSRELERLVADAIRALGEEYEGDPQKLVSVIKETAPALVALEHIAEFLGAHKNKSR